MAELFEYQPLVNDLRATLVERTSHAAWVLCVPSGDYGMVLDVTLATRPTANGESRPELVLTYVKFPTEVDIVALKVALEHWQRDAHTWPPPSWDTWDRSSGRAISSPESSAVQKPYGPGFGRTAPTGVLSGASKTRSSRQYSSFYRRSARHLYSRRGVAACLLPMSSWQRPCRTTASESLAAA